MENILVAALDIATRAHEGQKRKGTGIPYIYHPMAVSSLVIADGGDTDQAAAGLLHDVLEDGGAEYAEEIRERCGMSVLAIVSNLSKNPDIETRKERDKEYLIRLLDIPLDHLLVAACDKAHNAHSIMADYCEVKGAVFERFSKTRAETLAYYEALAGIMLQRLPKASATAMLCGALSTLQDMIKEDEARAQTSAKDAKIIITGGGRLILPPTRH